MSRSSHEKNSSQLELSLVRRDVAGERGMPDPLVRRSPRAKRLQVKVSPWKGIEVVVPMRCSQREADRFIESHRDWMRRAWSKLVKEYPEAAGWELPQHVHLPVLDRWWEVRLDPLGRRFRAGRDVITLAGDNSSAEHALRLQQWVRLQAAKVLPQRLAPWIERTGLEPNAISIRGQATRWGSCSSKGTLSLNFRLMFLDAALVDCLLLHELCHLKYMNHGKRFWGLMERFMPDVRDRDRALGAAWKEVPAWAQVKAGKQEER